MRVVSAAFCAASVALWASGPAPAGAESPVVLDGANDDQRDTLRDLLPDRDPPETLFEAERIAEEAAERTQVWLRSEGYYSAEVIPEAQAQPPEARVRIEAGPRFTFTAPQIEFEGDPPSDTAAAAVRAALNHIDAGAPARAADVIQAEGAAVTALQQAGYADASAGRRRVVVDHATSTMNTEFRIIAGAPALLGDVRAEPANLFREGFVDDLRNWDVGAAYTPEALARLRRDISSTGAVTRVSTRLGEPNADGMRDVVLEVEPAKRNAYELGVGYSTTEGLGVEAEWTRRNYTRRADALTVAAALGELVQSLRAELERPHAAGLGHTRRYSIIASREDSTAFTRSGVAIGATVDAARRLRLGLSYGAQLSADVYEDTGGVVENAYVLSGFADLRHDTTGVPLDARDGSIVQLRVEPSVSAGDESITFVRSTAEGRIYESFGEGDRTTLAARVRTGWLQGVSGDINDAPPDRRFYAGGGGSVRGYEYNSIYPEERDLLGLSPGGQGLLEISAEARVRFGDRLGAVAFVDGGAAFDTWEDAADLRWGVGVGARYDLGFAPLRVDLAVPLDARDEDPDFALYISLGQAF